MKKSPGRMIPISDLRRRFGEIEKALPTTGTFILTKRGKPFATLSALPDTSDTTLESLFGAWKETALDNDELWRDVLKRNSRRRQVTL